MALTQVNLGMVDTAAAGGLGMRNKIINGAMEIDQRNAGASVTPTNSAYSLDRWRFAVSQTSKLTCQQVSDAPAGFNKSLKVTSSSAYSPVTSDYFILQHRFEGYSTNDLNWGTSDAKTISVSFWVKSSLSGTFSGAIRNANGYGRGYVFEYTVNSSNTWEQKSVTITGDTSGSWAVDNSVSIELGFILGGGSDFYASPNTWNATNDFLTSGSTNLVATSGATFYITGVQLEAGSVATEFERRPYGLELSLCQRYFWKWGGDPYTPWGIGTVDNANVSIVFFLQCPVPMRTSPTLSMGGTNRVFPGGTLTSNTLPYSQRTNQTCYFGISANGTTLRNCHIVGAGNDASAYFQGDAEL